LLCGIFVPYPDQHRSDPSNGRPAKARRPIAVALQYELDGPSLPRVVASGQGRVAEQGLGQFRRQTAVMMI
jgi:type III secretion system FlhB-like substrate exporter